MYKTDKTGRGCRKMDMQQQKLHELIKKEDEKLDKVQDLVDWRALGVNISLKALLRMNLLHFAMYIAASDEQITYSETEVISALCRKIYIPEEIIDEIKEKNIYSTEFEQKVPFIVDLMVQTDNQLDAQKANDPIPLSEEILTIFKEVANAVAKADGEVTKQEKEDMDIYIGMLENYLDSNLERRITEGKSFDEEDNDSIFTEDHEDET